MNFLLISDHLKYQSLDANISEIPLPDQIPYRLYLEENGIHELNQYCINRSDLFICLLGSIYNEPKLQEKDAAEPFLINQSIKRKDFFKDFRGNFCGFVYYIEQDELIIFTDHMGESSVFYYQKDNLYAYSNSLYILNDVLKYNSFSRKLCKEAVYMLLTYGRIVSDDTVIEEVKKLRFGHYHSIKNGVVTDNLYYCIRKSIYSFKNNSDTLETIHNTLKQILYNLGDVCKNQDILIELSGGLDSRTINYMAHDIQNIDMISNMTFGSPNSLDVSIAKDIAKELGHEIQAVLIDENFLEQYDEIMCRNNGLYNSVYALAMLKAYKELYNSYHTIISGVLGDTVLRGSAFIAKEVADSLLIYAAQSYVLDSRLKTHYNDYLTDPEIYGFFMDLQSVLQTNHIRRLFGYCFSPFANPDLIDQCLSVPNKLRLKGKQHIRLLKRYYPRSCRHIWQATKAKPSYNLLYNAIFNKKNVPNAVFDYQSTINDPEVKQYILSDFEHRIDNPIIDQELRTDIVTLFDNGHANVMDTTAALSVLSIINIIWGERS